MNETQKKPVQNDMGTLAKDARSLMTATADVAAKKVDEVRQRVVDTVESAKEAAGCVRDQAVDYAKTTDNAVRENPYKVIGIAFGVGALFGYLVSRRGSRNGD